MAEQKSIEEYQDDLMNLWDKRRMGSKLDPKEWDGFYTSVVITISRCYRCKSLLSQCPEPAKNYYDSFFSEVIFRRLEGKDNELTRPNALCIWFYNYISSICKSKSSSNKKPVVDINLTLSKKIFKETGLDKIVDYQKWEDFYIKFMTIISNCHQLKSLIKKCPKEPTDYYNDFLIEYINSRSKGKEIVLIKSNILCEWFYNYLFEVCNLTEPPQPFVLPKDEKGEIDLEGIELDLEKTEKSAKAFLKQHKDWVSLYLKFHFCADKNKRETLENIAVLENIASHHYKARQLGCVSQKKWKVDIKKYKKTYLGKWLLLLDIDIKEENRNEIYFAFAILCSKALNNKITLSTK